MNGQAGRQTRQTRTRKKEASSLRTSSSFVVCVSGGDGLLFRESLLALCLVTSCNYPTGHSVLSRDRGIPPRLRVSVHDSFISPPLSTTALGPNSNQCFHALYGLVRSF